MGIKGSWSCWFGLWWRRIKHKLYMHGILISHVHVMCIHFGPHKMGLYTLLWNHKALNELIMNFLSSTMWKVSNLLDRTQVHWWNIIKIKIWKEIVDRIAYEASKLELDCWYNWVRKIKKCENCDKENIFSIVISINHKIQKKILIFSFEFL